MDVYGKVASEGYEFTGECRNPRRGESFLTDYGGIYTARYSGWRAPRLILRKVGEREVEMTVAEVAKKLGHKVKIVED